MKREDWKRLKEVQKKERKRERRTTLNSNKNLVRKKEVSRNKINSCNFFLDFIYFFLVKRSYVQWTFTTSTIQLFIQFTEKKKNVFSFPDNFSPFFFFLLLNNSSNGKKKEPKMTFQICCWLVVIVRWIHSILLLLSSSGS